MLQVGAKFLLAMVIGWLIGLSNAHAVILVNKNFLPSTIDPGATSTLVIVITNNVPAIATATTLADNLPPGMVLTGPLQSNSCLGTVTNVGGLPIASGDATIRLTGGQVPAGTAANPVTCSLSFVVTNFNPSQSLVNTIPAGSLTSSEGPNDDPGAATLNTNPLAPLVVTKTAAPNFIHGGGTASFTLVFRNSNVSSATFTVADSLPAGVSMTNVAGIVNSCGGALLDNLGGTLIDSSSGFRLNDGNLPGRSGVTAGACTVTFTVFAWHVNRANAGNLANTIPANITNSLGVTSLAVSANLSLQSGGAATKSFTPNAVVVPGVSSLTIVMLNRNLGTITGAGLTDTLPAFTTIDGPAVASPSCGGLVNFTTAAGGALLVGSTSIRINNATIPPSDNSTAANAGNCTVTVPVRLTAEGIYINNIAARSYGPGLPNFSSSGNVTLIGIADISGTKTFAPPTRVAGGTTTLSIVLKNNSVSGAANLAFVDNLRSMSANGSFTVLLSPAITNTCAGAITTTSTSFALTAGFLNAGASCQITVPIAISPTVVAGSYNNTLPAGTISSTAGTNTFAIVGPLTIVDPLTLAKTLVPAVIPPNTTSLLTITVTRRTANGAPPLTGIGFTDNLPVGLVVANPSALFSNCGGVASADPGGTTITLSAGFITGVSTNCLVRASVLATSSATNTIPIGGITTTEGFSNRTAATAALRTGGTAPNFVLNKEFNPLSIRGGELSRLQLIVNNNAPGAQALTSLSIFDVFPYSGGTADFVIGSPATPAVAGPGCTVGSYSSVIGSDTFAIFGASVPANQTCAYSINVTGFTTGSFNNQITSGTAISAQGATNSNTAQKSLDVSSALTIGKSFNPSVIFAGQSSTLTIVILNTTNNQLTGTYPSFLDVLPANLTVTAAPSTNCVSATVAAPIGTRTIAVNSGVFASNSSCSVFVPVNSGIVGGYTNVIPSGSATFQRPVGIESNAGAASAVLAVIGKPTLVKTFAPTSIASGGTSLIQITITNPNNATAIPGGLTGVSITDTLPSGLSVAGNQSLGGSCAGAGSVLLSDAATVVSISPIGVPAGGNCNISFSVLAATGAVKLNTTTGATSLQTGSEGSGSNVATLTVLISPSISKSFTIGSIDPGQTTALVVTLTNPNAVTATLSNPAFTDNFPSLPSQMTLTSVVATSSCGGGINNQANAPLALGDTGIRLNGGLIPPNASCSVSVVVTAGSPGTYTNVTSVLNTTNMGASTMTGIADLLVTQPTASLGITKTNGLTALNAGTTITYTLTVANFGPSDASNAVLTDVPTAGLNCTAVSCSSASGGAVCPVVGVAPFELSADNLLVNGVKVPIFPAGGQLVFTLTCGLTATGR